jgi:putative ABC transport system permease protein
MYILRLAFQKLFSRPVNTIFSIVLFAIGITIISLIIMAEHSLNQNITRNFSGIDMVVGAKGSPTQLILSAVLHADYPTGNIPMDQALRLANNPQVRKAIPLALGDSYRGFRIAGAPVDYPMLYEAQLNEGRWYEAPMEAALGFNVAAATGLKPGDSFSGVHGFHEEGHSHDDHQYVVTAILKPGAGVIDNLILTPLESVWMVHEAHDHEDEADDHDHHHDHSDHDHADHDHEHHNPALAIIIAKIEAGEDISLEEMHIYQEYGQQNSAASPDSSREITALLLQFRSPAGLIQFNRLINESTSMQAASPALEINRLLRLLSAGFNIFNILAWIIIVISGFNIFIHLWNTLKQGIQDIALMRVMGAGRMKVFLMMIFQGCVIAVTGWLAGILIARFIWILLPDFQFITYTSMMWFSSEELLVLLYALATGIIGSAIPAWRAYHTDVHFILSRKS